MASFFRVGGEQKERLSVNSESLDIPAWILWSCNDVAEVAQRKRRNQSDPLSESSTVDQHGTELGNFYLWNTESVVMVVLTLTVP